MKEGVALQFDHGRLGIRDAVAGKSLRCECVLLLNSIAVERVVCPQRRFITGGQVLLRFHHFRKKLQIGYFVIFVQRIPKQLQQVYGPATAR